jgi:hypothetical protein
MVITLANLNMKKLFTFGDSFTFNKTHEECEYSQKYRIDGDMHWPDIVANELNLKLVNFGYGGLSNDRILDNIIEKIDLISKDDIVIIGKTFYSRFDIPNNEFNIKNDIIYKFNTISLNSSALLKQLNFNKNEIEHIEYFLSLLCDENTKKRQNLRFDFIKKYLKNKKIDKLVFWEVEQLWTVYENIKTCTNGEIEDLHWSYKGHRDFSKIILNKIYHDTETAFKAKLI